MRRFKNLLISALLVGVLLVGTGAFAQQSSARVRFVHVIPTAAAFDIYTDGQLTVSGLEYGQASSYITLPAGDHQLALTPAGLTTVLAQQSITTVAGKSATLVASSANPLAFTLYDDDTSPLALGKARLLIIHAIANGPTVDVMLQRGDRIAPNLQAGQSFGPFDVPSFVYDLAVVPAGADLDKAILPAQSFPLANGTRYVLVIYGAATSPAALLLAAANDADAQSGLVRVAHTVPGAPALDIYVDDTLAVPSLAFGSVTEHMPVPSGKHTIAVRAAGQPTDLAKTDLTVETGKAVTVSAVGTPDQVDVKAFSDDLSGVAADKAVISLINTIPGNSTISVKLADGTVLADQTPFGEAAKAVTLSPIEATGSVTISLNGQTGSVPVPDQRFYGGVYYDGFVVAGTSFSPPLVIFAPTSLAQGIASAPGAAGKSLTVAAQPTEIPVQPTTSSEIVTVTPAIPPTEAPVVTTQPTQAPVVATQAPPATPKPKVPQAKVLLDPDARLNLREYPGADARTLAQAPSGTVLDVNGRQGGIQLAEGETPQPNATPFVDPATLLTDPKQDLDPQATWLNVTYYTPDGGTITAWVNAFYLEVRDTRGKLQRLADLPLVPRNQPGEAVNTAITPPPATQDRVTIKVVNLNADVRLSIRRTPDKEGEWLEGIPVGTVADFLGVTEEQDWVFIRYLPPQGGSITGWVNAAYVEYYFNDRKVDLKELETRKLLVIADKTQRGEVGGGAVQGATPTPNPIKNAYVAQVVLNPDARLNLRRTPDNNSEQIGQIPSGTQLIITGRTEKGDWLATTFENQQGWISSQFVTLTFNGKTAQITDVPIEPSLLPTTPTPTP
jgi:uncharacterized protein YraI